MKKVKDKSLKKNSVLLKIARNPLLYSKKGGTRIYLILSFLLPFVIIWYFFAKNEVHPFGDQQILVTDLWHQYYPFFRVEQDKLQSLSSMLYSWDTGIGTNFISLMSYYAASPLNLLSVFFPIEYSRDALTLFLTVKIGCAGLFFAIFLKHTFQKNDFSITGFALCYALCDYIMGYYWNVIWIDTVALLPLVALGTIKLFKEGKYKLYVISLALSLISSFYIGLFTCIFTVLLFAALVITGWNGFRNAAKRLGQIAGATVIGIGIGAAILLPAYLGLKLTNSANNQFPQNISYYEPWLKMISAAIGFHEPTAKEGLPNFYCGMFSIILLGVFVRSPKIKIREKIITVLYLAFIIVSCNMNVLNYMWHGFHFTNMLPYRFSFIFSFILLAAGYRAFTVLKEEKNVFDAVALSLMTVIIAVISYKSQTEKALISSVVVCLIFTAVTLIYRFKLINEKILNLAVFAVCFVEMAMNANIGVKTVTVTGYSVYPRKSEAIEAIIKEFDSENDFYRMETTTNYTINDPALYGYKGISQFSSTANVNVTNLMEDLGIQASAAGNRYYYTQNTAVFNMFFNLRYLMSTESYSGDLTYLYPVAQQDGVSIYENNHHLPLAFAAESSITDFQGEDFIQFENMNELFRKATGIEEDVLMRIDVKDVGHQGINVTKSGYGNYSFRHVASSDASEDWYLKFNYTVEEDGPVYALFSFSDINSVKVKVGNSIYHTQSLGQYPYIFAAGDFAKGETVTFQADVDNENGSGTVYVYQINKRVFDEGYKKLQAGALNLTSYSDTSIEGTINAENDCVMYTSIPYDGGWTAYIDGKKTEVKSIRNALMCVPLSAGEHKVELKYSPPGFMAGTVISVVSIALLVFLWIAGPKISARLKIKTTAEREEVVPTEGTVSENTEETAENNEKS